MGRASDRLKSDLTVKALAKGSDLGDKRLKLYADGRGLYLRVARGAGGVGVSASWVFRYMMDRRPHTMGLGPYPVIPLAEARSRALDASRLKFNGEDPIKSRKAAKRQTEGAAVPTFQEAAEAYIAAKWSGWSAKHAAQWPSTLKAYVYPVFGEVPVSDVTVDLVLGALRPIWETKTDTATKVRQRIEAVLDWAKAKGQRSGDNPAQWAGNLKYQLPPPAKLAKKRNHPALPVADLPAFMAQLRRLEGLGALALEFTILTAARSKMVRGMTWGEVDLKARNWTVPGERMKIREEHTVPLSSAALAVLDKMRPVDGSAPKGLVFPGEKSGKPLSDMTMAAVIKRMNGAKARWVDPRQADAPVVPHGFRSTFRDWAGDVAGVAREVAEAALAHTVQGVEGDYRRGSALEKRRELMADWAAYAASTPEPSTEGLEDLLQ